MTNDWISMGLLIPIVILSSFLFWHLVPFSRIIHYPRNKRRQKEWREHVNQKGDQWCKVMTEYETRIRSSLMTLDSLKEQGLYDSERFNSTQIEIEFLYLERDMNLRSSMDELDRIYEETKEK